MKKKCFRCSPPHPPSTCDAYRIRCQIVAQEEEFSSQLESFSSRSMEVNMISSPNVNNGLMHKQWREG